MRAVIVGAEMGGKAVVSALAFISASASNRQVAIQLGVCH